ncbi:MAG: precorrin-4 C(11)-methyltransferase [Pseudomonadota bacterium]
MKVYFIGAGPGDPELITLKGHRLIKSCPMVLYAGSLVPESLLQDLHPKAEVVNTAELHLDQIVGWMQRAHDEDIDVARVHSGDPSIYGAIAEQISELTALGIDYEIIPGVTATSASAAWLGTELTVPNISQTVIYTRYAGKTSMPEGESLSELAAHRATLAIHLGVPRIHKIVEELIPFYGEGCPVAVCYRTSWDDADKVTGTLGDIVAKVRERGYTRTALILVGEVLDPLEVAKSFLYREDKAHIFRPKVRKEAVQAVS